MIQQLRQFFNESFTPQKYEEYVKSISDLHPGALDFRNAETPVFVPHAFTQKMRDACEDIIDVIISPSFKSLTQRSIPQGWDIPGEDEHPHCIAFDFGVCTDNSGGIEPQLIEMQGFPSLFFFQARLDEITRPYANVPANFTSYLNGYNSDTYAQLLREIILGDEDPRHVILLEIYPEKQKTRLDFECTKQLLGLSIVCITKLIAEGRELFYMNGDEKVKVKRIFNRLIVDDLQQNAPEKIVDLTYGYDVKWIPHPNWFYRISKFTLPFIDNPNVPDTYFLHELMQSVNLDEFVLKPLFSFAGMGVVIDVTQEDIDAIPDPENWILQRKVNYAAVIPTLDEPAKAEIRLFYFWKEGWERPKAVHNLARLSKGKMIGTRYNKDKTWVGGTLAYFEQA